MKGTIVAIGVFAIAGAGGMYAWHAMNSPAFNPLKSKVQPVKGTFLRVTADYIYKGKPVNFDFLVVCGGRITHSRATGGSYDVWSGPMLYARKMPDGKALAISTKFFCSSFGDSLSPPARFMPLTIVYSETETLYSGYAYMSDDAYERANSPLKFIKANVVRIGGEAATDLAKRQVPNVVQELRNDLGFGQNDRFILRPGRRPTIGTACGGAARFPIPPDVVPLVRRFWPKHRPDYWRAPVSPQGWGSLSSKLWSAKHGGVPVLMHLTSQNSRSGVIRREPGGLLRDEPPKPPVREGYVWKRVHRMGEFYPLQWTSKQVSDMRSRITQPTTWEYNLVHSAKARGLYHCRGLHTGSVPLPPGSTVDQVKQSYRNKIRVNNAAVANDTGRSTNPRGRFPNNVLFYKDEAYFAIDGFTITSMTLGEQFNGRQ